MLAPLDPKASPHPPAAVTLPSLRAGGVAACLGTIFTEAFYPAKPPDYMQVAYPIGDAEAAHVTGVRQLERYGEWFRAGEVGAHASGARRASEGSQGTPFHPRPSKEPSASRSPRIGILVECADPIRTPDELSWWAQRGVVVVGMSWVHGSRYSGGNGPSNNKTGITAIGRDFVRAMDHLNLTHDISHLSQRATDDLFSLTSRPVIASHSNCRALIDGKNERHITDETIREVGRRGGVIGLNLCSPFLRPGLDREKNERASIDDAVRHIERIAEIHGHTRGVGLGSDMDGGFSAQGLPDGIDTPRDLSKLADALLARGWSEEAVDAFAWGNWARFFGI